MKMILAAFIVFTMSASSLAGDEPPQLSLSIKIEEGLIKGFVRNAGHAPVKTNANSLYGWWEFTTVSYFDGTWHEAAMAEEDRVRIGIQPRPLEVELKPNEVLIPPEKSIVPLGKDDSKDRYTFALDLRDYEFPAEHSRVLRIRVVTQGLQSDAVEVKNPNVELRTTIKPKDVALDGVNVFGAKSNTHSILKNVFIDLKFSSYSAIESASQSGIVETKFTEEHGIVWCPFFSSHLPEYQFSGHWQIDEKGEMKVSGKYEPANGATELPARLKSEKNLEFVISRAYLRKGYPPYTHILELSIRRLTNPSGKPSGAEVTDTTLPPSDPVNGGVWPLADRYPLAGMYRFQSLEPTNLWIGAVANISGRQGGAEIQLDRLYFPFPSEPSPPGLRQEILDVIGKAISRELAQGDEFRFVPTGFGYAGVGQIGGVIYLSNGHTLQDVLISQGLARVRQDTTGDAILAQPLLEYWLRCEANARKEGRGFWASHPELMRRWWDSKSD
jgi:hypothetical protein